MSGIHQRIEFGNNDFINEQKTKFKNNFHRTIRTEREQVAMTKELRIATCDLHLN